jgi:AI-2 transport protein TqsA
MTLQKTAYLIVLLIGLTFILIIGQSIIIPLILAFLIWFLIKELRNFAKRIPFVRNHVPAWLLNISTVVLLYFLFAFISHFLILNISNLSANLPLYQENLNLFYNQMSTYFGYDFQSIFMNYVGDFNFSSLLASLLNSITDILGHIFMIGLYLLFMLLEETVFESKVKAFYQESKRRVEIIATYQKINKAISNYIVLKTIVSMLTAGLSYIALAIIGIDSPLFWAFLIFTLNYIPTIGSLIATVFPAVMALMQFGSLEMALLVLGFVGVIQLIVGNIIEPRVMGNSLNISSLVVILSLTVWGAIWGIIGMILSVPIMVILIILFAQFENTKKIAILLSDKGQL